MEPATFQALASEVDPAPESSAVPVLLPVSVSSPLTKPSSLTPLICDQRAISRLLDLMLSRAGLSVAEASRRMGVVPNSLRQYLSGARQKPSLLWFLKFAAVCGARVSLEFPRDSQ